MADKFVRLLNSCLLSFDTNPLGNIKKVVAAVEELLGADCVYYNKLSEELMVTVASSIAPDEPAGKMPSGGYICHDEMMRMWEEDVIIFDNLSQSREAATDPRIQFGGLESYIGVPINLRDGVKGVLCAVFQNRRSFSMDDKDALQALAQLIKIEEERIQALEELSDSEEKFRTIFDYSNDMFMVLDENGRYMEVNKVVCELMGYSRAEMLQMTPRDLVVPEFAGKVKERFKKLLEHGSAVFETAMISKSGQIIETEINSRVIHYRGKTAFLSIGRDISARKLAEKTLQQAIERYDRLTNNADVAIFRVKIDGGEVTYANPAAVRMLGYTLQDWQSDPNLAFKCIHPDSAAKQREIIEQVKVGGVVKDEIITWLAKDGRQVFLEHTVIPVFDEDNGVLYFESIGRDITEQKQAREKISQSLSLLEATLDSTADGIVAVNEEWKIINYNNKFLKIFNISERDISSGEVSEVILAQLKSPEYARRKVAEIFDKPELYFSGTIELADGRVLEYHTNPQQIKSNIVGRVWSLRDITQQKSYEDNLRFISMHDHLTGLYNRAYFEEEISRLEKGRSYPITLISADLNGLKLVNDTMGHDKGDELLRVCGLLLGKPLRSSDVLARVGGDEFFVILPKTDKESGEKVVKRIKDTFNMHNKERPDLPLNVSLGVATANDGSQPLKELIKKADDKMYRDKLYRSSSNRGQIVDSLLVALSERDFISGGHADRLQEMAQRLGERVGLSANSLSDLLLLAKVHDLGKVGIPDHILFKKGKLTDEEWEIMKQHPAKGYRIAQSSPDLAVVADLILRHHERWDGKGYPLGLKGEEIPIECRILAIVDAYDAMTNNRPYNRILTQKQAVAELEKCKGTQFAPFLVEEFIEVLSSVLSHQSNLANNVII
ncbi:PAS domain S-box protein [Dethiobacter alkaliphilus]|uniref:PAS domain S-box protein n=1 Tax=Dethiobacter alkaliphilus TaxID=427926 RepID=UPI002225EE86|nr:PAS domain S-box protein [Dethiobacter alkaliphilus]MCW3489214.1 PAS domain S-box protein [Dethiobacter alkaliphilus]